MGRMLSDGRVEGPAGAGVAGSSTGVLGRPLVWLFATVSALTVANLYYHQPLLAEIARDFGVAESRAGFISTVTQVGYAAGLLLFVPLADVRERKGLIVAMLAAVAVALEGVALAPSLAWVGLASVAVGTTTVVPQLIIPFAAGLASPRERGRVVGSVVGGLLVGILGARVVSGLLGEWIGWRGTFHVAAAGMVVLALLLARLLPSGPAASDLPYPALIRSMGGLIRRHRVLREAAFTGAMVFGSFSAFWTTLAFRLEAPPFDYGPGVAGIFGLVGIAGASAAPLVGRLADRRSPRELVRAGVVVCLGAWAVLWLGGSTLAALVVGVTVLDAGAQGVGVSNQARIYALPTELHGRLNTVYMSSFFVGGALGSTLGATAWGMAGWSGVCAVGTLLLALALLSQLGGEVELR